MIRAIFTGMSIILLPLLFAYNLYLWLIAPW